jgi:4-amino-4-deoxy-L-arabinose transferase-like glycosyltransferase
MAISISAFGATDWAVRLPSAIAATLTIATLYLFLATHLRDRLAGFFAGAALMSTIGYVANKSARTADYEALLTLWTTLYLLAIFLALTRRTSPTRLLLAFGVFATLAVMTKTVQALVFFAPLALYIMSTRAGRSMLKEPALYVALAAPILAGAAFYAIRDYADPGYFKAALEYDIIGRYYTTAFDRTRGGPLFYVTQVRDLPWIAFLPFAAALALRYGHPDEKRVTGFFLTCYLGYLVVITLGKTKYNWYAFPLYPLTAIISGVGLSILGRSEILRVSSQQWRRIVVGTTCVALSALVITTSELIRQRQKNRLLSQPRDQYSFFLRELEHLAPGVKHLTVLHPGINPPHENPPGLQFYAAATLFYVTALNHNGYQITLRPLATSQALQAGEVILVCGDDVVNALLPRGTVDILAEAYGCRLGKTST